MTAPAFSLSVVLPGAPSSAATASGGAPTGAEGLFGGLLAGLVDGAADATGDWTLHSEGASEDATTDALAETTGNAALPAIDPTLAQLLASLGMTPQAAAATRTPTAEGDVASGTTPSDAVLPRSNGAFGLLQDASMAGTDAGADADAGPATPSPAFARSGVLTSPADNTRIERHGQDGAPTAIQRPASAAVTPLVAAPTPAAVAPPAAQAVPAPATPVAATSAAGLTAADVETVAAGEAVPAAPGARPAMAEGETRRAAGLSRNDRREAAGRSALAPSLAAAGPKADQALAVAAAPEADGEPEAGSDTSSAPAQAELAAAPEAPSPAAPPEARAPAAPVTAQIAEAPARGTPETVARLAADIVRKVEGQSTRFDLQLDPHGLGKVDVAIEIDRDGKLTAALSFDSAQSAAELRGRAGELRQVLEQAGFDIAEGGLTFDLSGQNAGFGGREAGQQQERAWTGRAFQRAQAGAEDIDLSLANIPSTSSRWTRSGVDIRI